MAPLWHMQPSYILKFYYLLYYLLKLFFKCLHNHVSPLFSPLVKKERNTLELQPNKQTSLLNEKPPMDWCRKLACMLIRLKQIIRSVRCDSVNVFVTYKSNKINKHKQSQPAPPAVVAGHSHSSLVACLGGKTQVILAQFSSRHFTSGFSSWRLRNFCLATAVFRVLRV